MRLYGWADLLKYKIAPKYTLSGPFHHSGVGRNPEVAGRFVAMISFLHTPVRGAITLDERTALAGIPERAWEYQLGSRSALEWVLDQYKERKPRDPTIREKFNTYRFSDHKEEVIDLLRQVCTVSVATMEIVESRVTPVSGPGKGD